MIDQKIIALINEELDGQTSATQSAQLRRHCETNPEAQAYADDLKRLAGVLGRVEQVEPPPSLKMGILNTIRAAARPVPPQLGFFKFIAARLSSPALPRYGFAVASGACLGVFLFVMLSGGIDVGAKEDQLSGSMGTAVLPARTVTDYGLFEGASTKASVQVVTTGVQIFVEAEVQGAEACEIGLMFPAESYTVVGIRRQGGTLESVRAQGGSVSTAVAGSGRVSMELERTGEGTPELTLELRQGGRILWDKALRASPGE